MTKNKGHKKKSDAKVRTNLTSDIKKDTLYFTNQCLKYEYINRKIDKRQDTPCHLSIWEIPIKTIIPRDVRDAEKKLFLTHFWWVYKDWKK